MSKLKSKRKKRNLCPTTKKPTIGISLFPQWSHPCNIHAVISNTHPQLMKLFVALFACIMHLYLRQSRRNRRKLIMIPQFLRTTLHKCTLSLVWSTLMHVCFVLVRTEAKRQSLEKFTKKEWMMSKVQSFLCRYILKITSS